MLCLFNKRPSFLPPEWQATDKICHLMSLLLCQCMYSQVIFSVVRVTSTNTIRPGLPNYFNMIFS